MSKSYIIPPTLKGIIALILWSTSSTVICSLSPLPQFELLTFSFGIVGGVTLLRLWLKNEWATLSRSFKSWGLVFTGVLLQQFLYIMAFNTTQPAEVDLIIYLWPSIGVVLSTLYFKERIRIFHIISVLFGTLAVISLSTDQLSYNDYGIGHLLAFACACSWACYSVFSRDSEPIHPNMLGIGYAIGFCIALPLHTNLEEFVAPSLFQGLLLVYFSLALTLGAFSLWTMGMQNGQSRYLMLSTYFKPFCSLMMLCAFGVAELTPHLLLAALLIIISGLSTNIAVFPHVRDFIMTTSVKSFKAIAIKLS